MNEYLRSTLIRLCKQPRSFEFISKNLSGLDPVEAMQLLRELETNGELVCINEMWCIKEVSANATLALYPMESERKIQKYMGYFDFLKTPHPLDFEWRNSSVSLQRLLGKVQKLVAPNDRLLFLGMPTLFATAIEKDLSNKIRLIERNSPIIAGLKKINTDPARFQTVEADIFTLNPDTVTGNYCVVMDPPWYTPHFFQFMWLAAKTVSIGGIVAISAPPINTRPNIIDERIDWFTFCRKLGLCIETLEPQQLQYAMPFFEFNALRAAGIKNILPFWRKGDLLIFRKVEEVSIDRPEHTLIQSEWAEREYNTTRIRVKISTEKETSNTDNFEFEPLVKGDILPTVSSRDERRKNVNVWTSGNRIFKCTNPQEIIRTIDNIVRDNDLSEVQMQIKIWLDLITELETAEFNEYLEWIYYEMERQTD
ncbi:MAG TPA: hypothetical protein VHA56_22085 [Mucilaginibacter sp.]|nr:hypothetical protein [Mucilaginibacter sp.]